LQCIRVQKAVKGSNRWRNLSKARAAPPQQLDKLCLSESEPQHWQQAYLVVEQLPWRAAKERPFQAHTRQ